MINLIKIIKNWFNKKQLKIKIRSIFFFIIAVYIIILFTIFYFLIKNDMINYILDSNKNNMILAEDNLSAELDKIDTMSKILYEDEQIVNYLIDESNNQSKKRNARISIYDINSKFDYISSIYIIKNDRSFIDVCHQTTLSDINNIKNYNWFKEIKRKAGGYVISVNGEGAFLKKNGDNIVSFIRLINDVDSQKEIGYLVVNLNIDILIDSYTNILSENRELCYFNLNNCLSEEGEPPDNINFKNYNNKKLEQIVNNKILSTEVSSFYKIKDTPFVLAEYEKILYFEYIFNNMFFVMLIIALITLIMFGFIKILLSTYITKPIERFMEYLEFLKDKWQKKEIFDNNFFEDKNIYINKNNLIEINKVLDEFFEKERKIRLTELEGIQEQIKPHFLYNSLESIADLALKISADNIYDSIESLGSFYRYFLSNGLREISMNVELDILKNYLKIQKLRYDNIFEDTYYIQSEILDIVVPKLILQPLVENSLYHGIIKKGEFGTIKVSVFEKNNELNIEVYDNGIGISSEKLELLMKEKSYKNFGLLGTIERMQYFYGMKNIFKISSEEGLYFQVNIKIPMERIRHA
jgi:two-component system sensor histidine kinase YesM